MLSYQMKQKVLWFNRQKLEEKRRIAADSRTKNKRVSIFLPISIYTAKIAAGNSRKITAAANR